MTLSLFKYAVALVAFLFVVNMTQAQQPAVQSMSYKLEPAGLNISIGLDQNAAALISPQLVFQTYKDSVLVNSGSSDPTLIQGKFLSFSIAPKDTDNGNEIEFVVTVKSGSATISNSSRYRLNLEDARNLKSAQEIVNSLTTENGKLKGTIKDYESLSIPTGVNVAENPLIGGNQVFFHFQTTTAGKIQVVIKNVDSGGTVGSAATQPYVSPNIQKEHGVVFSNLVPGQTYAVEAVVLNHLASGTPPVASTMRTFTTDARLKFPTVVGINNPIFTKVEVSGPDEKSIVANVALDQSDAYLQINLEELVDPSTQTYKLVDSRGKIGQDDLGKPIGDKIFSTAYTFIGLKPDTAYRLTFLGLNKFGKTTLPVQQIRVASTMKSPTAFAFAEGVNLVINPLSFTATWKATASPDSGSFEVVFPSGAKAISPPATIDKATNTLTASLDVAGLRQILDASKSNVQPKLIFTMARQGTSVSNQLTIATVLPKKEDVTNSTILNADEKSRILSVIGSTTDSSKKFKWQDLLSTGLGILLKFL